MKKLILVCLLAVVGLMNAQEKNEGLKGAWWAMGTLEYSNDEAADTSSFTILPIAGTFISPTVTVGAGVGYTSTTVGNADAVDAFVAMPLARKYWGLGDKFFMFGQAAVPMTFSDAVNTFGFQLSPGVDYFLSDHFTMEASFGLFGYTNVSPEVGDSYGVTNLGFDMTKLNFGLKYIF